jgi:hypothetical protein
MRYQLHLGLNFCTLNLCLFSIGVLAFVGLVLFYEEFSKVFVNGELDIINEGDFYSINTWFFLDFIH